MQDEQYVGSAGRPAAPEGVVAPASTVLGAGIDGAPPPTRAPKVDSVLSDQLWRAAILAARQAAMTAAELRRALDATSRASEL